MNENVCRPEGRMVTLEEVCGVLQAEFICGAEKLHDQIRTACGCDLMSDVLAFTEPGSILLTGLTNQQVIRTAEMLDLKAVVFVRDKRPDDMTLQLAMSRGLPILLSPFPLYECCGRLYGMGLLGCDNSSPKKRAKVRRKALNRTPDAVSGGD